MAKPDTWMPFYVGDYLADTMHLTRDEHGAYLLLIMAYWRRGGPLPDDAASLAAIARSTPEEWQRSLNARCQPFFSVKGGFWIHKRIDEELEKANRNIEQKRQAGIASANIRYNSRSTAVPTAGQRRVNTSPSPSPGGVNPPIPPIFQIPEKSPRPKKTSILPVGFINFWHSWPNTPRKDSKGQCCRFWEKNDCEIIADRIIASVRLFKQTTDWLKDGGQFIPKPLTFLNRRSWEAPVASAIQKEKERLQDLECGVG